jgi:hypothetical protein
MPVAGIVPVATRFVQEHARKATAWCAKLARPANCPVEGRSGVGKRTPWVGHRCFNILGKRIEDRPFDRLRQDTGNTPCSRPSVCERAPQHGDRISDTIGLGLI